MPSFVHQQANDCNKASPSGRHPQLAAAPVSFSSSHIVNFPFVAFGLLGPGNCQETGGLPEAERLMVNLTQFQRLWR